MAWMLSLSSRPPVHNPIKLPETLSSWSVGLCSTRFLEKQAKPVPQPSPRNGPGRHFDGNNQNPPIWQRYRYYEPQDKIVSAWAVAGMPPRDMVVASSRFQYTSTFSTGGKYSTKSALGAVLSLPMLVVQWRTIFSRRVDGPHSRWCVWSAEGAILGHRLFTNIGRLFLEIQHPSPFLQK